MNASIIFLALYGLVFLLPGWLAWKLMRLRAAPLLFSAAISYSLLVADLFIIAWIKASPSWVAAAWAGISAILAGAVLIRRRFGLHSGAVVPGCGFRKSRPASRRRLMPWAVAACVGAGVMAYFLYAGPYAELPADAWTHLGKIQDQVEFIHAKAPVPDALAGSAFFHQGPYWYWVAAFLCAISGLPLAEAMWPLAFSNTLLFALCLASFFGIVAAQERVSATSKAWLAVLAVLFTLAHQGVSVFAYFRYYVFAPTLLNFVIFLAVAALALRFLRGAPAAARALWLLPIFGLALVKVHTQEALFAFFICWAMGLAFVLLRFSKGGIGALLDRRGLRALLVAGGCTLLFVAGFFWLHFYKAPETAYLDRLVSFKALGSRAGNLLIMNPAGDCFQVVTLWGCFVYLMFFVFWKPLVRSPYIAGGMAIPLLTWFNPFTVDMFLRHVSASSVLYRIGYIIPLGYVAAYAAVRLAGMVRHAAKRPRRAVPAALALAVLVALLFPVRSGDWENPHSRIFSLKKIPPANDHHHWADAVNAVRASGFKHVVTDPLTAFYLRPLTGVQCADRSFWLKGASIPGHDLPVVLAQVIDSTNWVLLVNLRDGASSDAWRKSGHWPENILEVSRWYTPASLDFVRDHPDAFRVCWSNDNAAIYDIDFDALHPHLPVTPVMTDARPVMLQGPGIVVSWTSVRRKDFVSYHVQCSEDGETWRDLITNREFCYPWLNHQGQPQDRVGKWTHCLPSGQTYCYRVRAVFSSGTSSWSNIKSATVSNYR